MADRQDIDALMVGALYGELDAADRARLDAHLSSHPEDRAALEAMERTRSQVRRGLTELPEAEPPPSLSALLLQEAARRAPRAATAKPAEAEDQPGLWSRLLAWLRPVAMNPAFAGAAALLLVGGAAAALYLRDPQSAEPTYPSRAEANRAAHDAKTEPPAAPGLLAEGQATDPSAATPAEEFRADLADGELTTSGEPAPDDTAGDERSGDVTGTAPDRAKEGERRRPTKSPGYVEVRPRGTDVSIKQLEEAEDVDRAEVAAVPPPPADTAKKEKKADKAPAATGAAGAGGGAGARAPEPKPTKPMDPALEEWARTSHARLVRLVADGKCAEAGRLGAEIKDRAPEYYAANVANDRAVRACKQYIENQSRKKADKDYKSRTQRDSFDDDAVDAPASK